MRVILKRIFNASVAELADAPDLGSGVLRTWRFDSSRSYFFLPLVFCPIQTFPAYFVTNNSLLKLQAHL